jgi:hypothetical protein
VQQDQGAFAGPQHDLVPVFRIVAKMTPNKPIQPIHHAMVKKLRTR